MAEEIKIEGLKEIGEKLRMLSTKMNREIIRKAVRAGANVIKDEMKRRVPVDSGELRDNIISTAHPMKNGEGFEAVVGVRYRRKVAAKSRGRFGRKSGKWNKDASLAPSTEDPGVYARFVELGRPNQKGHTHQAAQPFMRPAFDTKADEAARTIAASIDQQLKDEFK